MKPISVSKLQAALDYARLEEADKPPHELAEAKARLVDMFAGVRTTSAPMQLGIAVDDYMTREVNRLVSKEPPLLLPNVGGVGSHNMLATVRETVQELAQIGPITAQVPLVCQSTEWPDVQVEFPISGKIDLMVSGPAKPEFDLKVSGMPFTDWIDHKYYKSLQWRIYSHAMGATSFNYLHLWVDYTSSPVAPGIVDKWMFAVRESRLSVSSTFVYDDYEHEQTATMLYDAVDVLLGLGLIAP